MRWFELPRRGRTSPLGEENRLEPPLAVERSLLPQPVDVRELRERQDALGIDFVRCRLGGRKVFAAGRRRGLRWLFRRGTLRRVAPSRTSTCPARACGAASRKSAVRLPGTHSLFGDPRKTITLERARELLDSPATHFLGPRHFEGINWAEHTAVVDSTSRGRTDDAHWRDYRIKTTWPTGSRVETNRITLDDSIGHRPTTASLPGLRGPVPTSVHAETWLAIIVGFCSHLSRFFLWTIDEAILFALTGIAPPVEPVSAQLRIAVGVDAAPLRAELVLRAQPFVSTRTIQRAAAEMQIALLPGLAPDSRLDASARPWPSDPSSSSSRSTATMACARLGGTLVARWDDLQRRRPGWPYRGNRANMRLDFERAKRTLTEAAHRLAPAFTPAGDKLARAPRLDG